MIKATAGTWVNYALTLAFQILFAAHYGTTLVASAFIIAFGIAVAINGVIVSGVQSVVVPRILNEEGAFLAKSVRFLGMVTVVALAVALSVVVGADDLARFIGERLSLSPVLFADLLRVSAAFLFLQVLAGELAAVGLARGQRFTPAVTPVFPSAAGCVALLAFPQLDVRLAYIALVAGSIVQVAALTASLRPPYVFSAARVSGLGWIALGMAGTYALLSLVPPLERVLAAVHTPSGAAQYDYAVRSLRAVQQLVLGGLFLAALGDWSSAAFIEGSARLRSSIASATVLAGTFLLFASSLAIVVGGSLVALLFQHGRFVASDTTAVTAILLLALPGFCCEGIGLIVSSALLARRRNPSLIAIGVANFTIRVLILIPLAAQFGAKGVAISYSLSAAIMLLVLVVTAYRAGLWPTGSEVALYRGLLVGMGTLAGSILVVLIGRSWPAPVRAGAVAGAFALLFATLHPIRALGLLPR